VPSFLCCELVYFMWPRKGLLAQPFLLGRNVPQSWCEKAEQECGEKSKCGMSNPPTTNRSKEEDEHVI